MLLSAFVISLFIHFLVLNHTFFSFPALQNTHTIVVELARPTPPKTTPSAPKTAPTIEETTPSKPTKEVEQKPVTPPEPPTESTSHIDPVAESSSPSNSGNPTTPSPQEAAQIASKPEEPQPEPSPVLAEASMPLPEPYVYVKSEFEVKRGTDKIGKTSVTFSTNETRYTLESVFTPTGLASLLVKDLTEKSEGYISEKGIKPETYIRNYGNDPEKEQRANFAWSDRIVELSSAKGQKLENLEPGTQDFLSFMYQFMFTPPLNDMQILMTNGKKLKTYVYSFVGEENLTTKFGELKTIHLLKQGDDEEKTEIWLATEYKHIPVQIRKTEKDGTVYEQAITKIFTDAASKPNAPQ